MDRLQPIGEILAKNQQGRSQDWNEIISKTCGCGTNFEDRVWHFCDGKIIQNDKCQPCRQKEQIEQQKREALTELKTTTENQREIWMENCGLPVYFLPKTFENYESKLQVKAFLAVKNLQWKGDNELRPKSLVLTSPGIYGVGKTHLMAALMNQIADTEEKAYINTHFSVVTKKCPFYFVTETELLRRIRDTYNQNNDDPHRVTEEHIYKKLGNIDLLIIDDVGKVRPKDSSFLQGVYFNIIDQRYNDLMPIVMTTNLDYAELEAHIGGACADRLREMCGNNFIKMSGTSHRKGSK